MTRTEQEELAQAIKPMLETLYRRALADGVDKARLVFLVSDDRATFADNPTVVEALFFGAYATVERGEVPPDASRAARERAKQMANLWADGLVPVHVLVCGDREGFIVGANPGRANCA